MRSHCLYLLWAFSALSQATPRPIQHGTRSQDVKWSPCDLNGTVAVLCGSLTVPLDYTVPNSTSTLDLELFKVSATKRPSEGSILLNFGGPGDYGGTSLSLLGEELLSSTGGTHDLVAFAARGTSKTLTFSCNSIVAADLFVSGQASNTALGQLWSYSSIFSDNCLAAQKVTGSLIGTAFVARDMMQIVDALESDGLLRYWGFSYGTVLGATAAAMFPERMDKIVLDGVVNTKQYYHDYSLDDFIDADAVFDGFISGCVASPDACPLARNHTFNSLKSTLYTFLENLKFNPVPISTPTSGFLVDYSTFQSLITEALYAPGTWPMYAAFFDDLMTGNYTSIVDLISSSSMTPSSDSDSIYGIMCGDKFPRANSLDGILPTLFSAHRSSRIAGDVADRFSTICAQWGMEAKERYSGNFNAKTKSPMLLIGNTYDPFTPLISAQNVSADFDGSVLLQHDGYGHSSLAQASLCTAKAVRSYFANGTLPEPGTICPVAVELFSDQGDGWTDVIKELELE